MVIFEGIGMSIISLYDSIISSSPPYVSIILKLIFLILVILTYSVFVWKFYRFIAAKNFLDFQEFLLRVATQMQKDIQH